MVALLFVIQILGHDLSLLWLATTRALGRANVAI